MIAQNTAPADRIAVSTDTNDNAVETMISLPGRVGIYNGNLTTNPEAKTLAQFGVLPGIVSTYYQHNKPGMNVRAESARLQQGIAVLLTVTTKRGSVTLADIAACTPAAEAWLGSYIAGLRLLSEVNPNQPVYATVDHEFEVKVAQGHITGISNVTYAAALSRFLERCHAEAPQVQTVYWFGESRTDDISMILDALAVRPMVYAADPYRWFHNPESESVAETFGNITTWLRAQVGEDARMGIAEFGTDKRWGDESNRAWISGVREAMRTHRLEFALLFNRGDMNIDALPNTIREFGAQIWDAQGSCLRCRDHALPSFNTR